MHSTKIPPKATSHPTHLTTNPFTPKETPSPPTTAETNKDQFSDILSDSDISILDLGPSLSSRNSSCYQLNSPKFLPQDLKQTMTSHTTAIKYVPKNPTMPDDLKTRATFTLTRSSDRNDPSDSTRLTPKKNKIRPGSVRGALRTFSSPLLSPLRVSGIRVGRSGISRAKTSFRGVGGVLER